MLETLCRKRSFFTNIERTDSLLIQGPSSIVPVSDQAIPESIPELLQAAAAGNATAWNALVDRFSGLLWAVTRGYGLSDADAADVCQTAWLRLVEHLDKIREPDRVGSWLAAVARNETFRMLRRRGRQIPVGGEDELELMDPPPVEQPESRAFTQGRDEKLWSAVARLSDRCRVLLRLLMADPPSSYDEISVALAMPIGSIGPTRLRCLERLRTSVEIVGITVDDMGS